MISPEYLRFIQTLNAGDITPEVRKIANLVLKNLNSLISLSTAHGQRIKKIVKLAQSNWMTVSANIQPSTAKATAPT